MNKYIGKKYGRLTVKSLTTKRNKNDLRLYLLKCSCGNEILRPIALITSGHARSCGCFRKDHPNRTVHGCCGTSFYNMYKNLNRRCDNKNDKNYKNYGGRGITNEWKSFIEFKNDMYSKYIEHQKEHDKDTSLDRINNDGNYSKNNCRWATARVQCNNTRKNRIIYHNGKEMSLTQWSRYLGMKRSTLNSRINIYKWSIKDALEKKIIIN